MIIFKIDECEDFDALGARANKDYFELHFFLRGRFVLRERYLRGLFNKWHFMSDLDDLNIPEDVVKNILNFYFTYGNSNV